jgi:hypothetical protein
MSRLCAADTSPPLLHPATCSVLTVRAFVVLLFVLLSAGALSDALTAVRWAAGREGQSLNIKVRRRSNKQHVQH